jgi:hypothetical protein
VHVYHAAVVPGGSYVVQLLPEECAPLESNFSAVLARSAGSWGDLAGPFNSGLGVWPPPDGRKDIVVDVVAVLEKFGNRPAAPIKARADVEPATVDQKINLTDVVRMLDAFRGLAYPFLPGPSAPCAAAD